MVLLVIKSKSQRKCSRHTFHEKYFSQKNSNNMTTLLEQSWMHRTVDQIFVAYLTTQHKSIVKRSLRADDFFTSERDWISYCRRFLLKDRDSHIHFLPLVLGRAVFQFDKAFHERRISDVVEMSSGRKRIFLCVRTREREGGGEVGNHGFCASHYATHGIVECVFHGNVSELFAKMRHDSPFRLVIPPIARLFG